MKHRFTPRAANDLRDILAYLGNENPAAANRLRSEILRTLLLIETRPQIGLPNARDVTLRSFLLLRLPYRIHYYLDRETIWIVHIRHTSRRPWTPRI